MNKYDEFDLKISKESNSTLGVSEPNTSSNLCWAVTGYWTGSIINGGCKTVNDCASGGGRSVCTPCGSAGYKI